LLVVGQANNDSITIDYSNGSPLPSAGITVSGGGGTNTLSILGSTGADTVTFNSASVSFLGTVNYSSIGAVSFDGKGGGDTLSVTAAQTWIPAAQKLASMNIANAASVALAQGGLATVVTDALVINGTGMLDVSDDALIVNYTTTPPTTLHDYLVSGRNAGPA